MRNAGLLLTAWLSLSACRPGPSDQMAAAQVPVANLRLPTPTGAFGVGRTLQYWTDATRRRELPVWVYYPAARPARSVPAADSVLPAPAWARRYHELLTRRLGSGAASALLDLRTSAQRQTPVAGAAEQQLPVLLFAPGLHWLPTDYSVLLEELASQGYVVVAWAPPQYAGVVQLKSGQLLEGSGQHDHGPLVADFRFVRQQLTALNDAGPLRGRLDLSRVGALGHSIGGAAAVGTAQNGGQLRAVANLDGDFDDAETTGRLAQPVLYLTSEPPGLDGQPVDTWEQQDRSEARRQRVWAQVQASAPAAYRVRLPGVYHSNFLDAALLPAAAVPEKLRQNRFGRVDGAQGLRLTAELLTAFFNAELRGQAADALLQLQQRYPAIRIEARR